MNHDDLPDELLIARGRYATVRGEHEDEKKRLSILCGGLSATSAQVLRAAQPDNNEAPDPVVILNLLDTCRKAIADMDACAERIGQLAAARQQLRPLAWPKPGR